MRAALIALALIAATPAMAQPVPHDLTDPAAYDDATGQGWEDPQRWSVKTAPGNYRVTLTITGPARLSVLAESRRLMLEDVSVPARETAQHSFIVNVRDAALPPPERNAPGASAVRISTREQTSLNWDDRLTLEFLGDRAAVQAVSVEPVTVPTLYLLGDSTVTDQPDDPAASWGQMLPRFMTGDIAVANHAWSGETLKSFATNYRLAKVLSLVQPGDMVAMQFGHNDQKQQWPQTYVAAGSTYDAWLAAYIAEVRLRGATPILINSPERRNYDDAGRIVPSLAGYPAAVRQVAQAQGVPLVELTQGTIAFYEALGPEEAAKGFADDGRDRTHHNTYGAYQLARIIAAGMAQVPQLAGHVAPLFRTYDPASPPLPASFTLPPSIVRSNAEQAGS
ncbi:rhamnogalacturonan acetylesterase [Croceibacterium ferulae]|uniref:rhamnogalacturonan acetylesterase n=1 Tax=Croceibacterium ferulae TaxID=1854641 RepID=UPI0019D4E61C|nr:rhamnogalacturonan acetylesterase [Croceibacterium ferulae]